MTNPRLFRGKATIRPVPRHVTAFDLYCSHFGLSARPFAPAPDPDFLFWSKAHQHAFATLEFGVLRGASITVVSGEIGTGKTTLVRQLLKSIGPGVRIGLVSNTGATAEEVLRWALMSLGQSTPRDATHPGLVAALQEFLFAEHAEGRRVVVIFDEAQNLCREALEELRILTNINTGKNALLQIVLIGQPGLRSLFGDESRHSFVQRVAASFHLGALDAPGTDAYIAHRLRAAGAKTNLFKAAATDLVHEAAGGIPRRINQLCDLAMLYAYTADQATVQRFAVQQVLDDGAFFGASLLRKAEPALR